jgi:hypothetical protein
MTAHCSMRFPSPTRTLSAACTRGSPSRGAAGLLDVAYARSTRLSGRCSSRRHEGPRANRVPIEARRRPGRLSAR